MFGEEDRRASRYYGVNDPTLLIGAAIRVSVIRRRSLLALLYGPAVCCKLDVTDLEMTGLAHLYSALERSVLLPAIMDPFEASARH